MSWFGSFRSKGKKAAQPQRKTRSAISSSARTEGRPAFSDRPPDPRAKAYLDILSDTESLKDLICQFIENQPEKRAPAKDITLHVVTQIFGSDENLRRLNAVGAASEILKNARMRMKEEGILLYDPRTQLWSVSRMVRFLNLDDRDRLFLATRDIPEAGWQKAARKDDVAEWLYRSLTPDGFEHFCVAFLYHLGCLDVKVSEKRDITPDIRGTDGGIDGYGFMCPPDNPAQRFAMAFQAKKYGPGHPVSEPEVRDFAGALAGAEVPYGFFITTSFFSTPAKAFLNKIKAPQIAAIDGSRMVDEMILPGPDGRDSFGMLRTERYNFLVRPSFLLKRGGDGR